MVRSPKVAKLREVRTLHLSVSEAHRLPLKLVPNPYFVVTFNQVIIIKILIKDFNFMLVYHADTNSTVFSFNVLPVLFITYTVLYIEPDERNTFFF